MRLFISINFTEEIKNTLFKIRNNLKQHAESGNFTTKENLHLTLAFLGEVSEHRISDVVKAMKACSVTRFSINISEFGNFNRNGEKIYWYGVKATEDLSFLQKRLINELKKNNFTLDEKKFQPHITLARRCKMKRDFIEGEFNYKLPCMEMIVEKISLMRSERVNGTLIYIEIEHIPLH